MMLDDYPDTFTLVQIHVGDDWATPWGDDRADFYSVLSAPTAWFDGIIERWGSSTDVNEQYGLYEGDYLTRMAVPTDVTIDMVGEEVGEATYEITATVCIDPNGSAKSMRIYMVHVLDHWPAQVSYSRNGFRQAAATEDISLDPGQCQDVVRTFAFDPNSWSQQEDIKIIAWAQEPLEAGPAEVHQAAFMNWPFPTGQIPGDCDDDGDVDLQDFLAFQTCFTGPGGTLTPGCECADFDGDDDVDLQDFLAFQVAFTGPL